MKFRQYLKEESGSINAALWISPKGQAFGFSVGKHIDAIVENPKKFGYTKEQIDAIYDKYDEKKYIEGKAREELIKSVIRKGFIRLRRYRNRFWSVNLYDWNSKSKDLLITWAMDIIRGVGTIKEDDIYMPVKIDCERGSPPRNITIEELAKTNLDESKKINLKYVLKIGEFEDMNHGIL